MAQGMFLAKALFDNIAETTDELAFRRGDVMTVLEQEPGGLEGWWFCTMRGKQGIAPGNRLKILSGMTEPTDSANSSFNTSFNSSFQGNSEVYDSPNRNLDYDVPPPQRDSRTSCESLRSSGGSRVASLGDDLYDTPPGSKRSSADTPGGMYDTPPGSKRTYVERTPPHSNRSSVSRESGSIGNLSAAMSGSQQSLGPSGSHLHLPSLPSMIRHRRGSRDNCYDTPPGSNRSSLERILSEEGPPIYDTLSPSNSIEQIDSDPNLNQDYDVPPTRTHILSQTNPASQMSLRSAGSIESLLSNTSGVSSTRLSHTASLPDSARSSMDIPSDNYDVPPVLDGDRSRKQLSTDSGLGFYDSPSKSRLSSSSADNPTETLKSSQSAMDCKQPPVLQDIKRSKSLEHALDDVYDIPRNNAPKVNLKKAMGLTGFGSNIAVNDPSSVYDIPPQVTRDSVISLRSDSSDENTRLSSSSFELDSQIDDLPFNEELLLDEMSALELLTKRQQDVNKATARLCGFVNEHWRSRANLEKTLYDIKLACTAVKTSLSDYLNFAKGAVANAARYSDKHLTVRLNKLVTPLQSNLNFVKKSYSNLEDIKWQVQLLSEPMDKTKLDDLGHITLLARELMPDVKRVSAFIQSNSSSIFHKSSFIDPKNKSISTKPPIGPTGFVKSKSLAQRPLPAVPSTDLLNTSLPLATPSKSQEPIYPKSKVSMYDIKAAIHQDDYAECDELPEVPDQTRKNVMEQCIQEYDYVQLDSVDDSKSTETSSDNSPSRIDSEEVITPTNKTQNDNLNNKTEDSVSTRLNNLSIVDSDVDMVPVRDTGLSQPHKENVQKKIEESLQETEEGEDFVDSGAVFDRVSPSESEKTPVNSDTQESHNFILPSESTEVEPLDPNDRQVLTYYTDQINTHSTLLANAVDAFIGVVGSNQPPNVFISHGKFVIVSAHKLVYIGDSIHRNLISNTISSRIMQCASTLCDCLKASVTATKAAALQYPSVPAVQEMVNKVIAVSKAAQELKKVITQSL